MRELSEFRIKVLNKIAIYSASACHYVTTRVPIPPLERGLSGYASKNITYLSLGMVKETFVFHPVCDNGQKRGGKGVLASSH